ncbi:hypothetical protein [Sphingobacterium sp. UBA6645]|uniref:hypothetical protein n=1 Tax=Sphingobacterium sp. UBA6645 TaxID=1947511 RepID=UPI0025E09566|nr:hypothetical protein [Sphingobacterium sp. UBA6645]
MIQPITLPELDFEGVWHDKVKQILKEMSINSPSREEQFETALNAWFSSEYPEVDTKDADAVREVIERDKLSIVRDIHYNFGGVLSDGNLVMRFGDVPNIKADIIYD